jgi:hypothetical protein
MAPEQLSDIELVVSWHLSFCLLFPHRPCIRTNETSPKLRKPCPLGATVFAASARQQQASFLLSPLFGSMSSRLSWHD